MGGQHLLGQESLLGGRDRLMEIKQHNRSVGPGQVAVGDLLALGVDIVDSRGVNNLERKLNAVDGELDLDTGDRRCSLVFGREEHQGFVGSLGWEADMVRCAALVPPVDRCSPFGSIADHRDDGRGGSD